MRDSSYLSIQNKIKLIKPLVYILFEKINTKKVDSIDCSDHRTQITNDDQVFTNLKDTHADGINKFQTNNVPNQNDGCLYENTSLPGLGQPVALGHIPMSQDNDMYETHSIEDEFSDELYEDEYDKVTIY